MDTVTTAILDYVKSHPYDKSEDVGVKIVLHRGGGGSFDSLGRNLSECDTVSTEGINTRDITDEEDALLDKAINPVVKVLEMIRNRRLAID